MKNRKKLGLLITSALLSTIITIGLSIGLMSNSIKNTTNNTYLTNKTNKNLADYLYNQTFDSGTITNDFSKIKSGSFKFKRLNNNFESNITQNNESFGLIGTNINNTSTTQPFSYRSQINFHQYWFTRTYTSNNLNHVNNVFPTLSFEPNSNIQNNIKNMIYDAVESVWSTQQGRQKVHINNFFGWNYGMPRVEARGAGTAEFDASDAVSFFGDSLSHNDTRRWNLYSITKNGDLGVGYAGYDWTNPCAKSDINKVKQDMLNIFNRDSESLSVYTPSLKFDSLIYTFKNMNHKFFDDHGGTDAYIRIFDNTYNQEQSVKDNFNQNVDDFYSNNTVLYKQAKNPNSDAMLGNLNTIHKSENIYVDFSKLITIDFESTSKYYDSNNDVHKQAPVVKFSWNLELMKALKEASTIANLMINAFSEYKSIKQFSESVAIQFKRLLLDVYNQKAGEAEIRSYFEKLNSSGGSNLIYNPSNKTADYALTLDKYKWGFKTNYKSSISDSQIIDLVNEIASWGYVYDYVLPQVFSNDIYAEYKQTGDSRWIMDANSKIYDGKTFQFIPIVLKNYQTQQDTYNNQYDIYFRNFYMRSDDNKIVAGFGNNKNQTLSSLNVFNASESLIKTKSGFTNKIHFKYDPNDSAIKLSFAYNPDLTETPIVNSTKNRSLTSVDYYSSDIINDEDRNKILSKAVAEALHVPKVEADKNGGTTNIFVSSSSFDIPQIDLKDEKWKKYPDLYSFIELAYNYDKINTGFRQTPQKNTEQEMLNAKKQLDNLQYFYVNVVIYYPIDYYMDPSNYWQLTQDQTIIPQGEFNGYWKYFIKLDAKYTPLNIDDLSKYVTVTNTANTVDQQQEIANLKSEVIKTKNDIKNQLNSLKSDLPISSQNLKNALEAFGSQVLMVKQEIDSLKNKLKNYNNQLSNDLINIQKYQNTFNDIFKQFELLNAKLNNQIAIEKDSIELIKNNQLGLSNSLVSKISKVMDKYNEEIKKIDKYKNDQIFNLLRGNSTLMNEYESIINRFNDYRKTVIDSIKTSYNDFKNKNKFTGSGFIKVDNRTFDYLKQLEELKNSYLNEINEINKLFENTNQSLKDEIKQYSNDVQNQLDSVNQQTQTFINTTLRNYLNKQQEIFTSDVATYLNQKFNYLKNLLVSYLATNYTNFSSDTFNIYKIIDSKNKSLDIEIQKINQYLTKLNQLFNSQQKMNDLRNQLDQKIQSIQQITEHQFISVDMNLKQLLADSHNPNVVDLFEAIDHKRFSRVFFYADRPNFANKLNSVIYETTGIDINLTWQEFFLSYSYSFPENAYNQNERGSKFSHEIIYNSADWVVSKWIFKIDYRTDYPVNAKINSLASDVMDELNTTKLEFEELNVYLEQYINVNSSVKSILSDCNNLISKYRQELNALKTINDDISNSLSQINIESNNYYSGIQKLLEYLNSFSPIGYLSDEKTENLNPVILSIMQQLEQFNPNNSSWQELGKYISQIVNNISKNYSSDLMMLSNLNIPNSVDYSNKIRKLDDQIKAYKPLSKHKVQLDGGMLAGVIIGGIVAIFLLIGLIIFIRSKRKPKFLPIPEEDKIALDQFYEECEKDRKRGI